MDEFLRRLRYYFRRSEFEAELDEEMAHHRSLSGASQFGNVTQLKEGSRTMWGWKPIEDLWQDLRYAVRAMASNKTFTSLAVLSLALGIGANAAVYSFTDSVLVRSLPVQEPDRLVRIEWQSKQFPKLIRAFNGDGEHDGGRYVSAELPYPVYPVLSQDQSVFSNAFVFKNGSRANVIVRGVAGNAITFYASGDFFRGLGTPPATGRLFGPDDDQASASPVVVLSYAYAQHEFGDANAAVGKSIVVINVPFTVVGVTTPEFFGVNPGLVPEIYIPMRLSERLETPTPESKFTRSNYYWADMMARLQPGVSIEQAQAALAPRFRRYVESTVQKEEERADMPALFLQDGSGGLDTLRRRYSKPLWVVMTLVALVLLLACTNITNLLLARAAARRREIAVRLSIGAGRWRIIRQLLTESTLLATLGGLLGIGVASWGIRVLTVMVENGDPSLAPVQLNWRVLCVTAALALCAGLVAGLAPALQGTRIDMMPVLKEARGTDPHARFASRWMPLSLSRCLVVSQISLSLLLLVAAGLFVRTLANLNAVELGFNPDNLLLFEVNLRSGGYSPEAAGQFHPMLSERMRAIPGVLNLGISSQALLAGELSTQPMTIPGVPPNKTGNISTMGVGPGFFATMQIPLLAGRAINEHDIGVTPQRVVVNERFAKEFFDGRNPLGQVFKAGTDLEIVGVARDAQYGLLREGIPTLVYTTMPKSRFRVVYALRTQGDPLKLVPQAREVLRQADARIPLAAVRTQEAQIARGTNGSRILAQLCTAFAVLALLIAAVGLFATTSYGVERRTNEIGVRMALGAHRAKVMAMVMREVIWLVAIGIAIGLPVALAGSKYLRSFLYGMEPMDPAAIGGAAAVLLTAIVVATWLPARRASRIDPMVALRHE